MIILVTGGLGFIGSHLIKNILTNYTSEGHKVYNIDNMSVGSSLKNLNNDWGVNYSLIVEDINNISRIEDIEKPDVILNAACRNPCRQKH